MWFFNIRIFFFVFFFVFSSFSSAQDNCENIFGSRLYYDNRVLESRKASRRLHPNFVDPIAERNLQKEWDVELKIPVLLKILLPKDVHFIKYQQYQPGTATAVKVKEPGEALLARAYYSYQNYRFGTNVAFSARALVDNMQHNLEKNWLVGQDAKAAILFLHGGGTKSTGSTVAVPMISHFRQYGIDVVSLDLPWHAQGHREFLDFESEIKVLGAFVQKYIPSNVPLFVWGHSWGSVFAEKLMTMTDRKHPDFQFHSNLKGVIILSTAVDAAPGRTTEEKYKEFLQRLKRTKTELRDEIAESEQDLFNSMVEDGKISPMGAFYSMGTILQLDQTPPSHKGKEWVPALMVVGKHDPLVYLGFKDLYEYYKGLENVETHYLDKLPYNSKDKNMQIQKVGHLIGDYLEKVDSKHSIQTALTSAFIAKQLGLSSLDHLVLDPKENQQLPAFIRLVQLAANELAFREFLKDYRIYNEKKHSSHGALFKENKELFKQVMNTASFYSPPYRRVAHFLDNLTMIDGSQEGNLKQFKEEMRYITRPDFLQILANRKLQDELLLMSKEIETLVSNDVPALNKMSEQARNMMDSYSTMFQSLKTNQKKPLQSSLSNQLYEAKSMKEVAEIIQSEQLPFAVARKIEEQMREYLVNKSILANEYLPPLNILINTIPSLSITHKVKRRMRKKIKRLHISLQHIMETLKKHIAEYIKLNEERIRLKKEHEEILQTVIQQIKIIKAALKDAVSQPPNSLIDQYQASRQEFNILIAANERMEQGLEQLSARVFGRETLQVSRIIEMLHQNKPAIDNFVNLYSRYIHNRGVLRGQIISAMEGGELGERLKAVVINLYGHGSEGRAPRLGSSSTYSKLERLTEELAIVEAKLQNTIKLKIEANMQYNTFINTLVQTPAVQQSRNEEVKIFRRLVSNILSIVEVFPVSRILNGEHITGVDLNPKTMSEQDKQAIIAHIKDNKSFFIQTFKGWKDIHSTLPPLLPTISE